MKSIHGKRILIGVSGGIAIYKTLSLISLLTKAGADCRVLMTEGARKFISPLSFQTMSGHRVYTELFDQEEGFIPHIDLTREADVFLIAPATADLLAKLAHGLGDDLLSSTFLASVCPVILSPSMNVHMFENPSTQANLKTLKSRGVILIDPKEGHLACKESGLGRMPEPEELLDFLDTFFTEKDLKGKKIIITGGPTKERFDPVRYITNDSSGKQGVALARRAIKRGAKVIFIHGDLKVPEPQGSVNLHVEKTKEMLNAVDAHFEDCDALIMAAAPCDMTPSHFSDNKMKKAGRTDEFTLSFRETVDILKTMGQKKTHQVLVGFAAETRNVEEYAKTKLTAKNADYIVANNVALQGAGFDGDTNVVTIYGREDQKAYPMLSKSDVADRILDLLL